MREEGRGWDMSLLEKNKFVFKNNISVQSQKQGVQYVNRILTIQIFKTRMGKIFILSFIINQNYLLCKKTPTLPILVLFLR